MRITSFLKRVTRPFVDIPAWMGTKQLGESFKEIGRTAKDLLVPRKADTEESFDEAIQHYNLTEEDLQKRIKIFGLLSAFWLIASIITLGYGIYLAGSRSIIGFVACTAVAFVCLGQAFYYHFWMFQMKQRRLGCTFRDWLNANFMGGNK